MYALRAARSFPKSRLLPYKHLNHTMANTEPQEGATLTGTFRVTPSDLASATSPDPNDVYAEVLATPRVCSFMEIVAARMLVPHLAPGQLSVGARIDLTHFAATPVDEDVSVAAKFLRKEGKLYVFDVSATDAGGEIAKARHERAVIEQERLMRGARKRIDGGSKI